MFIWGEYQDCRSQAERSNVKVIGMMTAALDHMSDDAPDDIIEEENLLQEVSGSSSAGAGFDFRFVKQPWDGNFDGLNFILGESSDFDLVRFEGFETRIYQNGELLDTLKIKRGAKL